MRLGKQFLYGLCIGFVFLVMHMFITQFQFDNPVNFTLSFGMMLVAQFAAFSVLNRKTAGQYTLKSMFIFLCITQCMSILLLTANAILNPFDGPSPPVIFIEVLISLLLFGILLPLLITALIWYMRKKKARIS